MSEDRCKNCLYWEEDENVPWGLKLGCCHRYPVDEETPINHWCGEFKETVVRVGLCKAAFLIKIRERMEIMVDQGRHDVAYGLELALELGEKLL